jgi:hypothetical protein
MCDSVCVGDPGPGQSGPGGGSGQQVHGGCCGRHQGSRDEDPQCLGAPGAAAASTYHCTVSVSYDVM